MAGSAEQVAAAAAAVDEATRRYQMSTAEAAAMGERITNLNRRQSDFEGETRIALSNLNSSIQSLASEMRSAIAGLSTNISDRSRPQWQALGVALVFAGMLGGLAYRPIREATSDLKSAVQTLADRAVTRDELEQRAGRAAEDRVRMEAALADIRSNLVPRAEHSQVLQDLRDRIDRIEMGRLRIGP